MVVTLAVFALVLSRSDSRQQAELASQNLALLLSDSVGTVIDRVDTVLLVAHDEILRQRKAGAHDAHAEKDLGPLLAMLKQHLPAVEGLHFADADGRPVAAARSEPADTARNERSIADRNYFKRLRDHVDSGLVISPPLIDRDSGKWVVVLARRISDANGTFLGIVFAPVSLDYFAKLFARVDVGNGGTIALRDGDLGLVVRYPEPEAFQQLVGKRDASAELTKLAASGAGSGAYEARSPFDQKERIYAFRRIAQHPLYIAVGLSREESFADWQRQALIVAALTALVLLISVLSALFAYRAWRERSAGEQRFRSLYLEAPLAYQSITVDDGRILDVNDAWCTLFGYTREEAIGRRIAEFFAAESRQTLACELPRFIASGRLDGPLLGIRRKDGALRQVSISGRIAYDEDERPLHTHCILIDVTEMRHNEETLRKLSRAVEQSRASIVITNTAGEIEYVNPHFCEVTGYRSEEVLGQNPRVLKSGFTSDDEYKRMWETLSGGGNWRTEFLNRRRDGSQYWEDASISAITDDAGTVINYVAVKEDITARKEAEEHASRLTRLYAALSMSNEAIIRLHDRHALFDAVCRIAVTHGRLRVAIIREVGADGRLLPVASFGEDSAAICQLDIRIDDLDGGGPLPSAIAMLHQSPFISNDFAGNEESFSWRETLLELGVRSLAAFPLLGANDRASAVMTLYSAQPGFFDRSLLELLNEMSLDLGYALDNLASEDARRLAEAALLRKSSMYAVLSRTSQVIVRAREQQSLLDEVCEIAMTLGGFRLVWIGRADASGERILPVAIAGPARAYLDGIEVSADAATGESPAATAIREQKPVIGCDCVSDDCCAPRRDDSANHGLKSCAALPVRGGDFNGALVVHSGEARYFDGDVAGLLSDVAQEISFALQKIFDDAQAQDAQARMRLHSQVFDHSAEAMVITDSRNRIIQVNRAFTEITGYTQDDVRGADPSVLKAGRQDRAFYQQMWATLMATDYWQGELWNRRKSGEIYPEWTTINAVRDGDGQIVNYFAVFSDLTQKKVQEEAVRLRRIDALTGLPNRLLLEDRTVEAIAHARPYGRYVALMAINLDRFHVVNESLGHAVGDEVLRLMARRLSAVIGEQGTVSRLSGDTFALMLPDLNVAIEVGGIAQQLLSAVAKPILISELDSGCATQPGVDAIHVTARVGIALFPDDGADFDALLRNTESALLLARDEGRATYRFFTPDLNVRAMRMVQLTTQLRQALDRDELRVFYQAQFDADSGRIIGFEALARMSSPSGTPIPPGEFIPLAEATGMIGRLGEYVLREACRQLKRWQDAGHRGLVMAVNVSPLQMRDPALADRVAAVISESGVAPGDIELEVTEGAMMNDVGAALRLLRRFKAMGLRLAIDDFGTGYSSLSYLKDFPIDRLKIDQSFVRNITTHASDAAIADAIVALARALGMSTLAEGVETEAQFAHLRRLECNAMQGYLFARPAPAEQIDDMLRKPPTIAWRTAASIHPEPDANEDDHA
jgi:PAS domain S-box-containing protein/diguanylate cyclase (GGDEF)-like protein